MDGGAWWATVHGVAKSRTRLNDVTFTLKVVLPLGEPCLFSDLGFPFLLSEGGSGLQGMPELALWPQVWRRT